MIELRQFRQFIAVAEELNFRRAAERLHMAQPPLTAAIQRMEEELGILLFERNNRVVRITEAGEAFLREARRTIAQAERAFRTARRSATGLQGELRVNFVDSTANFIIPRVLKLFRQAHPDVEVELQEATTADQLVSLQADRIDVAFVVLPINPEALFDVATIYRDRWVAAIQDAHPLAGREEVSLFELRDDPWILFPGRYGPGVYERIVASCEEAGIVPRIVQRVRLMQTAIGLVAGGIGVALVPRLLASMKPAGVRFLEICGPGTPIPYDIAMLSTNSPNPLRDEFVQIAKTEFCYPNSVIDISKQKIA